ncbi:nitroreductase family protein [Clostridium cylindrosporum]|uniref:Nitroreductase n=1 Tax=Clostridium cylindrosporum DSM 605 TaxID=1121307 RepID=A0A0J8DCH6_CLOCY|nr:nitroreductase family protein [Clostridium cylindrosporum]KMT21958.1 nitroreductase [Clostridium cylindrosporum DSM 605]
MMKVDIEKCIGCKQCVRDCFPGDIKVDNGKAEIRNVACFKCGHCIAVCPTGAISTDDYKMEDVVEYNEEKFNIDSDTLLNFIKFRRSIRHFKDKDVEKEKLEKIIEAGRFTQTGSNSQGVSYVVVKDKLEDLKEIVLRRLSILGEEILNNLNSETIKYKRYAMMWQQMYKDYKENPKAGDKVFFNAPAVILVISDSPVDAALASSNMELMTNALGLGTFFSGFLVRAAIDNQELVDLLGLKPSDKIVTSMVIGYPDIKFKRTVPRKDASILWK